MLAAISIDDNQSDRRDLDEMIPEAEIMADRLKVLASTPIPLWVGFSLSTLVFGLGCAWLIQLLQIRAEYIPFGRVFIWVLILSGAGFVVFGVRLSADLRRTKRIRLLLRQWEALNKQIQAFYAGDDASLNSGREVSLTPKSGGKVAGESLT